MEGEVRGIEAKEGQRRKEKEGEREGGKGQKNLGLHFFAHVYAFRVRTEIGFGLRTLGLAHYWAREFPPFGNLA
jgi:hypothetical protein